MSSARLWGNPGTGPQSHARARAVDPHARSGKPPVLLDAPGALTKISTPSTVLRGAGLSQAESISLIVWHALKL